MKWIVTCDHMLDRSITAMFLFGTKATPLKTTNGCYFSSQSVAMWLHFGIRRALWLTVDGASTHKEMTSMYNMLARGGDAWHQRKWRWLGTFNEVCTRRATNEASYLDLVPVCTGGTVSPKGDRDTPAARPAFDNDRCLKLSSHRAITLVLTAVSSTYHLFLDFRLLPTMS
jgi:hypothetical protein